MPLTSRFLDMAEDPLVKLNLATSLIKQRYEVTKASKALEEGLEKVKERLSIEQNGLFHCVGINRHPHLAAIARYPETEDLVCQLKLYSILATCNSTHLKEMLRT